MIVMIVMSGCVDLTEYVWSLHVLSLDWTPPYCRAGSRVLQNYQLNLESLSLNWAGVISPLQAPAPHVFRMSREGIRLLRGSRAAEYWTNYLFLAPTHLIITRTYQIEFPHLLLIYFWRYLAILKPLNVKIITEFILLYVPVVPSPMLSTTHLMPNQTFPVISSLRAALHKKIFLSV